MTGKIVNFYSPTRMMVGLKLSREIVYDWGDC